MNIYEYLSLIWLCLEWFLIQMFLIHRFEVRDRYFDFKPIQNLSVSHFLDSSKHWRLITIITLPKYSCKTIRLVIFAKLLFAVPFSYQCRFDHQSAYGIPRCTRNDKSLPCWHKFVGILHWAHYTHLYLEKIYILKTYWVIDILLTSLHRKI